MAENCTHEVLCAEELEDVTLICDLLPGHKGDHATMITWEQEGPIYLHNHEDCPADCIPCNLMRLYTRSVMSQIEREEKFAVSFKKGREDAANRKDVQESLKRVAPINGQPTLVSAGFNSAI